MAAIDSTRRGIDQTYASKALKIGLRVGDLIHWNRFQEMYHALVKEISYIYKIEANDSKKELDQFKRLRDKLIRRNMIVDTIEYMNKVLASNKRIIAEGSDGTMADIDFGPYPNITSSTTTVGGVCTGLGVPPSAIETNIGIMKAYTTRVGGGPFPTELTDEIGAHL